MTMHALVIAASPSVISPQNKGVKRAETLARNGKLKQAAKDLGRLKKNKTI
jgi:phosphoribosylpyrophosphate synthetase